MSTATETKRTVTKEIEPTSALDQAIAATSPRVQSIRADAAKFLGVPPDKVCALLRNVWKPSKDQPEFTDSEMFMGMSLIARYGLDPIAREVYVGRDNKGRLMTIIGIDGFIKIMHNADGYDGFEQEIGWNKDGTEMEWVETRIYSKQFKRPTVYRAFAKEYAKLSGFMYDKIPWHMLRLFSLHHAVRMFTPIGGQAVTPDEARWLQHYTPESNRAASVADDFAKELGKAKQPQPEPAPEAESPAEAPPVEEPGFTQDGGLFPDAGDAPGPDAMYLDALDSAEGPAIAGVLQQARQEHKAGKLTDKHIAHIEARAKRRAKETAK